MTTDQKPGTELVRRPADWRAHVAIAINGRADRTSHLTRKVVDLIEAWLPEPDLPTDQTPGTPRARCYCGGPEEALYGHPHGSGRHCKCDASSSPPSDLASAAGYRRISADEDTVERVAHCIDGMGPKMDGDTLRLVARAAINAIGGRDA